MTTPAERIEIALDAPDTSLPPLDGRLLRIIGGGRSDDAPAAGKQDRNRELYYRRFLDALGVAVYTTDAAGLITFYNAAAATFWGRKPAIGEEWCGSLRIFRPDGTYLPHDECPMAIALREGRVIRGVEAIVERPDGSRAWFMPFPTPLHDDDGRLMGAVNVLVDITERRRAEEDLRATARALESSNAVKDDFLGLVSHELRTPVTTIFGNARLLQDRGDSLAPDTRAAMVADIATDAERLHAIIENLLQLTRLGAGPQPDLEPQVMERVVRRAVLSFRRRHPRRPIVFDPGPNGVIVEADRTWLELVVENLLSNADKYSPADTPVELTLQNVGGEVEVAVLDRGIGLGDTDPAELFKPFYRGRDAQIAANGIGVGLAVCERIVAALGGRIWARPRDGGGAVVGFALPIAHSFEDEPGLLS